MVHAPWSPMETLIILKMLRIIRSVRPGLTGMASLILRDEEGFYSHREDAVAFYSSVISPYKQEVELWYVRNRTLFLDVRIVVATMAVVLIPSFGAGSCSRMRLRCRVR